MALVTVCSQTRYAYAPMVFEVLRDLSAATGLLQGDAAPLFITAALVQHAAAGTVLVLRLRSVSSHDL